MFSGSMVKTSFAKPFAEASYVVDHSAYRLVIVSKYVLLAIALSESQMSVDFGITSCAGLHPCMDAKARLHCACMSDRKAYARAMMAIAEMHDNLTGL